MSDELRAAAERALKIADSGSIHPFELEKLVVKLCVAYLSSHPADSDTPIDEEWLRSVGWNNLNAPHYWRFIGNDGFDVVKWTGGWNFRMHDGFNCKTRSDVRRLCAALGIELKEPASA